MRVIFKWKFVILANSRILGLVRGPVMSYKIRGVPDFQERRSLFRMHVFLFFLWLKILIVMRLLSVFFDGWHLQFLLGLQPNWLLGAIKCSWVDFFLGFVLQP